MVNRYFQPCMIKFKPIIFADGHLSVSMLGSETLASMWMRQFPDITISLDYLERLSSELIVLSWEKVSVKFRFPISWCVNKSKSLMFIWQFHSLGFALYISLNKSTMETIRNFIKIKWPPLNRNLQQICSWISEWFKKESIQILQGSLRV